MKNKRIFMTLTLLIIVLLLGIGYAVTNKTLVISGIATAIGDDANFVVRFKKTGENYDSPTNLTNATGSVSKDDTATIAVTGLKKAGDTATATYTIENVSDGIDASVVAKATVDDTTFFEVTTTGITDTPIVIKDNNATATVTITVKLLKTPLEEKVGNVTVTLTASPVQQ